MLATGDPHDPSLFLDPEEHLLWTGRPDPSGPLPRAARFVRWVGYFMGVPFATFLLIGIVNLDEMEGALGLWIGFLALTAVAAALLVWVVPAIALRGRGATRYGVTGTHAMIVRGLGRAEVLRYPVVSKAKIHVQDRKGGLGRVVFGSYQLYPNDPGRRHVRGSLAFDDLPRTEAKAAEVALRSIRGAAGKEAEPRLTRARDGGKK